MKTNKNYSKSISLLLLIVSIIYCGGCKQNTKASEQSNERKITETKSLVANFIKFDLRRDSVYLSDVPFAALSELCAAEVINEHPELKLTVEDLMVHTKTDTSTWSNTALPAVKYLKKTELAQVITTEDFRRLNNQNGYFILSRPVFSKDYQSAVMVCSFICGSRCGQSETILFQKRANGWWSYKKYCVSVS
jgi:hypothetical protein